MYEKFKQEKKRTKKFRNKQEIDLIKKEFIFWSLPSSYFLLWSQNLAYTLQVIQRVTTASVTAINITYFIFHEKHYDFVPHLSIII